MKEERGCGGRAACFGRMVDGIDDDGGREDRRFRSRLFDRRDGFPREDVFARGDAHRGLGGVERRVERGRRGGRRLREERRSSTRGGSGCC